MRNAHSLFLEQLGSLGIVGLLLLVGFFATPFAAAARALQANGEVVAAATATFAAFAIAAALDWMWEMTVVAIVGIVCAAVLLRAAPRTRVRPMPAALVITGAAALLIGALVIEGALVLAAHELDRSQAAAAAGNLSRSRGAARLASRIEPWAATPHLQLALVDEQAGRLVEAEREIRRALRRDGSNWQLWFIAARIERKRGETARARASLERAAALDPRSPRFASVRHGRR